EATPGRGRASDQLDVARREHDDRNGAEGVAQLLDDYIVALHPLLLPLSLVADRERVRVRTGDSRLDVEAGSAETRDVAVARGAHGTKEAEVVDRLEEIGLALPVVADGDETVR